MLDVSQPNWAAQLYTATTSQSIWSIEFQFSGSFTLRKVDLSLFFCPLRRIPNLGLISVRVYQSILFPEAHKGLLLGNVTLNVEIQNCADLTQIALPTSLSSVYTQCLIEFSMGNVLGGIYVGEISFRDEIPMIMYSKLFQSIYFKFV